VILLPLFIGERAGQPRFIYAHVLMPHPPYLFDRNGRRWPTPRTDATMADDYLEQLIFVNRLAAEALSGILANSATPPVIIVQGDHGFRGLTGPDQALERKTILNAYLLPGEAPLPNLNGITPVNTFRLLLNRYLGTHYEFLEETALH
jgi:hypothetical protein